MATIVWGGTGVADADAAPVAGFAVCVAGGRLVATGTRDALRTRFPEAHEHGGEHLLLMPALVDSHDHGRGLGSASLGIPDDLLEIWLPQLWGQPTIDPYLAAAYDGLRLLRAGVSLAAHSHNPRDWRQMGAEAEATLRGYRDAGIRVAFHPPIVDQNQLVYDDRAGFLAMLPPALHPAARQLLTPPPLALEEYLALCDALFEQHHDATNHTAHIQVSPAGGQWCSDDLVMACVAWARRRGTRVQMHMLETRYQRHYARRRWGTGFVRHLDDIGALGPWLTLAHMVWADPDDLALLAERGVAIAHNPSSNLRLRSGIAPLAAFLRQGVRVGVGLDGHALDEDQDYVRELRLAWTLGNRPGADAPTLAAREVWRLGTSGGAAATLGEPAPLGRLAEGQLADLVLVDWEGLRGAWFDPEADPVAVLLRKGHAGHIRDVMVGGRWVVRDGRSTTLDERAIVAAIRAELAAQAVASAQPIARDAAALAPYLRRFYARWDTNGEDGETHDRP